MPTHYRRNAKCSWPTLMLLVLMTLLSGCQKREKASIIVTVTPIPFDLLQLQTTQNNFWPTSDQVITLSELVQLFNSEEVIFELIESGKIAGVSSNRAEDVSKALLVKRTKSRPYELKLVLGLANEDQERQRHILLGLIDGVSKRVRDRGKKMVEVKTNELKVEIDELERQRTIMLQQLSGTYGDSGKYDDAVSLLRTLAEQRMKLARNQCFKASALRWLQAPMSEKKLDLAIHVLISGKLLSTSQIQRDEWEETIKTSIKNADALIAQIEIAIANKETELTKKLGAVDLPTTEKRADIVEQINQTVERLVEMQIIAIAASPDGNQFESMDWPVYVMKWEP